ncbi:MAG TPA: crossover junction endodeoxyribonuclease RuvC, partial [Sphingomicrobium sp.]|nr:crossover junction endodeoxyribonuclease RuvC [Sphingomicrobium sp.]
MLILGLDPGLGTTGWGVISAEGNRLSHIANGQLRTDTAEDLPRRLAHLATMIDAVIADHAPQS